MNPIYLMHIPRLIVKDQCMLFQRKWEQFTLLFDLLTLFNSFGIMN